MSNIGTVKRENNLWKLIHNFMSVKTSNEEIGNLDIEPNIAKELEASLKKIETWSEKQFKVGGNSTKTSKEQIRVEEKLEKEKTEKEMIIQEENEKER